MEEDGDEDGPDDDEDAILPELEPSLIGLLSNQEVVKKDVEPEGERNVLYSVRVLFRFWAEGSDKWGWDACPSLGSGGRASDDDEAALALEVAIAAEEEVERRGSDEPLLHGEEDEEGEHVRLKSGRGCEP